MFKLVESLLKQVKQVKQSKCVFKVLKVFRVFKARQVCKLRIQQTVFQLCELSLK